MLFTILTLSTDNGDQRSRPPTYFKNKSSSLKYDPFLIRIQNDDFLNLSMLLFVGDHFQAPVVVDNVLLNILLLGGHGGVAINL